MFKRISLTLGALALVAVPATLAAAPAAMATPFTPTALTPSLATPWTGTLKSESGTITGSGHESFTYAVQPGDMNLTFNVNPDVSPTIMTESPNSQTVQFDGYQATITNAQISESTSSASFAGDISMQGYPGTFTMGGPVGGSVSAPTFLFNGWGIINTPWYVKNENLNFGNMAFQMSPSA